MDEQHRRLKGHELGQTLGGSEGQGGLVRCSAWGHTESRTRLSDSTTTGYLKGLSYFAQVKRSKTEFASSVVQYVLFIDGKHIFQT